MIRCLAVLVMAGLMIGMIMALRAGLCRNGVRRSRPDYAAYDEGERDKED